MSGTQAEQTDASSIARVSRTIAAPVLHVWETLVSPRGAEALLGAGANLGTKGQSWHSDDGHRGVVRSLHPLEQVRVSWHESQDAPTSVVEIDLIGDGDGTRVDLSHDRVRGDLSDDEQQWNAALDRFEEVVRG